MRLFSSHPGMVRHPWMAISQIRSTLLYRTRVISSAAKVVQQQLGASAQLSPRRTQVMSCKTIFPGSLPRRLHCKGAFTTRTSLHN